MAKPKKKIYRFTGKEGSFMSEELLKKWMKRHEDFHAIRGHFYGKDVLLSILNQPGCMGIRFYHAIDDKNEQTLVLVGADAKGASMWAPITTKGIKKSDAGSGGADNHYPCPPYC